jgi:hypothetical protein
MPWLRRRRSETDAGLAAADRTTASPPDVAGSAESPGRSGGALVPLVPADSLQRTERALLALAAQSAQLHGQVVSLEHRVDALADALLDRLDVPTFDDLLEARSDSARVAAELARLEVNLAARLESVRAEIRAVHGTEARLDLRTMTPNDTGWAAVG